MTIENWQQKGKQIEIYGHSVFYVQQRIDKPTICFLHGYPSASYDYHHVLPLIEKDFSYVIHDHLGFGFSAKPLNYSYSLIEQAEIAMDLWKELGLTNIHLVAHDYGTSVANEIMVRKIRGHEPVEIKTLTLCNGSMHIEMAKLKVIQKLLRHPFWGKFVAARIDKQTFIRNMRDIWFDKSLFDDTEMSILYDLLKVHSSTTVLHKVSQYNNEREKYWHRWIGNLPNIDIPTHILWAQQDPIAVKEIAEKLHSEIPHSVYTKIDKCGHYPMLEQPEIWANSLKVFLTTHL